jgi:hypothetical protein
MQGAGRTSDPSWPARVGRSIANYFMNTMLGAVRPALGQVVLAAAAACFGGLAGWVPDATLRWALIGVAGVLLLTLAVSIPLRRRRTRRACLRDGAREAATMFSTSLARDLHRGPEALGAAFDDEVLGLAAMRLATSTRPDGGGRCVGLELGMIATSATGAVRWAHGSGSAVCRPLRALGTVETASAEDLLRMVAANAWGAGHVCTAVVAAGTETLTLFLVSDEPIAPEHDAALVAMADTLRPVLSVVRREAAHAVR